MKPGFSQDVFFSSQIVPYRIRQFVSALHGPVTDKKVRGKAMELVRRDTSWNSESKYFPRSLAGPVQIYSKKTVPSLKVNALVAYRTHVK